MAAFSTLPSMSAGGQGCERAERKHEGEPGEMGVRAGAGDGQKATADGQAEEMHSSVVGPVLLRVPYSWS
ncbi:MAG: hypothetical protein ACO39Q_10725 [Ilumatobacteraceae bacterium]